MKNENLETIGTANITTVTSQKLWVLSGGRVNGTKQLDFMIERGRIKKFLKEIFTKTY